MQWESVAQGCPIVTVPDFWRRSQNGMPCFDVEIRVLLSKVWALPKILRSSLLFGFLGALPSHMTHLPVQTTGMKERRPKIPEKVHPKHQQG